MSKPLPAVRAWTEKEDEFLIFYGRCLNQAFGGTKGYEYVARHDLKRSPEDALTRAETLRRERPLWVKRLEAEADKEPEE